VDIDAHLDSGAEVTVLNGGVIVPALRLELLQGEILQCQSAIGFTLETRRHQVKIPHPALGSFLLDAAISTVGIKRNLLGRDFFNLLQIGFRENQQTVFISSSP
jgi:hypothetical protein